MGMLECTEGALLTISEASERLGVSKRRIYALRDADVLNAPNSSRLGLVTLSSVVRYQRLRDESGGRPFSPRMAFGVLYLLSGLFPFWLNSQERYRARGQALTRNPESLVSACRKRAVTESFWCCDSLLHEVEARLCLSGASGTLSKHFSLTESSLVEGYVSVDHVEQIKRDYRLESSISVEKVRIHTASFLPQDSGVMPVAVCAADLAVSVDPRERDAGIRVLKDLQLDLEQRKEA